MASLGDESSVLSSSSSDKSKSPSQNTNNSQDNIITEEKRNELMNELNEVPSENANESSLVSEKSNNSQVNMDLEYSSEIKDSDDVLSLSEQSSTKVPYRFNRLSESSVSIINMQSNSITPISSPSLQGQYSTTTDHSTTTDQFCLEPIDDHSEHIPFNDLIMHQTEINGMQTDEKTNVQTDKKKETQSHKILSVNVGNKGIHEWSFKILDFNVSRLEIGVVSVNDTDSTHLSSEGIKCSEHFGARAVYGMELKTDDTYMYYASYNGNGYERCYKRLTKKQKANNLLWKKGDIIRVWINYHMWKIKFYLNDKIVRKALSLQRDHMYYPIIAFWGDCKYESMDFK